MKVLVMRVKLRAVWVHSLKEKRMIVKSVTQKLKNKFNVSVAEIEDQDIHQSIVIGIVSICGSNAICDSTIEKMLEFIENNTDAEMIDSEIVIENY